MRVNSSVVVPFSSHRGHLRRTGRGGRAGEGLRWWEKQRKCARNKAPKTLPARDAAKRAHMLSMRVGPFSAESADRSTNMGEVIFRRASNK